MNGSRWRAGAELIKESSLIFWTDNQSQPIKSTLDLLSMAQRKEERMNPHTWY